jgi:hypothetical protein
MPDLKLIRNGAAVHLHDCMASPRMHLMLCGPPDWNGELLQALSRGWPSVLKVHLLAPATGSAELHDPTGEALSTLGVAGKSQAQYLVRPDGHISFRCAGADLTALELHLNRLVT